MKGIESRPRSIKSKAGRPPCLLACNNFAVSRGEPEVRISRFLGNVSDWTTNSKSSSGQSQLGWHISSRSRLTEGQWEIMDKWEVDVINGRKVHVAKEC